jgi:predicted GTPase
MFEALVNNFRASGFAPTVRTVQLSTFIFDFLTVVILMQLSPEALQRAQDDEELRVAIVGVPNVGKSSLLNKILGHERSIVSPIPGTTTDPIDEKIMWAGKTAMTIIDTAGVRKRKQQNDDIEKLSALWSLKVIERSTVSLLLIDAKRGPEEQDVKVRQIYFHSCQY